MIKINDVSRQYQLGDTNVNALNNINLNIQQGEFIALVGPSGSGKSTILNLLGGLDRPSSGDIEFMDLSLTKATEKELNTHRRHNVGFIFQNFNLLPTLSALENVALPLMLDGISKQVRTTQSTKLLQRVGLGHRLHHRPTELSGGEQQRAAIARALINSPDFILADEPTGNLDSATGSDVMELLRTLNKERGATLIVVTHDPEIASFADRIVHLKDGEISNIEKKVIDSPNDSLPSAARQIQANGNLTFKDLLQTAVGNLRRRPVRNILTSAGIVVGIITLVTMVSFGVGVQEEVNRNFRTLGLENVFISPSFAEQQDAFDPFSFDTEPINPLTQDILAEFQGMPEVESITPILNLPDNLNIIFKIEEYSVPIRLNSSFGLGPSAMTDFAVPDMLAGGALGQGETSGTILMVRFANQLLEEIGGDYSDLIGRTVTLTVTLPRGESNEFVTIIKGVQNSHSYYSIDLGLEERINIKSWWFAKPNTLEIDGYDLLIIKANSQNYVPLIMETADSLNIESQSLGAVLDIANRVLALMQALLGSVGGLALLVATLGVANTMMMAIYERTREIGILKALGASNKEVRRLFIADAILLGFIGGIFGLILGTMLGQLVDWIGHIYLENEGINGIGKLSVVPVWLAIGSLLFSSLIGVIGGYYPATRAAKLDPIASLKHE